jgi:hypothetical protein
VLLAGFALSTWMAYRAERSSRLAWLADLQDHSRRNSAPEGGSGVDSNGSGSSSSRSNSSSSRAAPGADADESALRRAVAFELVEPLPNDADYWLQLALPCMLCIGIVACAIL